MPVDIEGNTLKNVILNKVDHKIIPQIQGLSSRKCFDQQYSQYGVTMPFPIYLSGVLPSFPDIYHKRVKEHYEHNHKIERYRSLYKASQRKKQYREAKRRNYPPNIVTKFAELLEKNPDPLFSGKYDWYLTGGNLDVLNGVESSYLAHVTGENLDTLVVSKFHENGKKLEQISSIKKDEPHTDLEGQIYEIQFIVNSGGYLLTRRKNLISLNLLNEIEGKLIDICTLRNENVPFISSTKNVLNTKELVTSNLERTVLLWDIEVSNIKHKQLLFNASSTEKSENWNCIRYYNENIYAFVGLNQFSLIDTRLSCEKNNTLIRTFNNPFGACDNISNMTLSRTSNLIYLTSSHKLFAIDPRYMDTSAFVNQECINFYDAHQMDMPPVMLKTLPIENSDFIILSSHINGDIRLYDCSKSTEFVNQYNINMPIKVPNISDAISNLKINGKCIDPVLDLDSRKNISQSGIGLFSNSRNYKIFSALNNGDIFSQEIISEMNNDSKGFEIAQQWEDIFMNSKSSKTRKLLVNKIENLSGITRILKCRKIDEQEKDEPHEIRRLPKWQRPINELKKFSDNLSSVLLAIWDVDELDMLPEKKFLKDEELEQKSDVKISEWLENCPLANESSSFLTSPMRDEMYVDISPIKVSTEH